ncbi:MAG: ABC transporter substrate-binding protein [Bacillota bacterium]
MKIRASALRLALIAGLLMVAVTVTACSTDTATGDDAELPVKVRLSEVTHSVFYAPQYVALTEGFFEDEGLDVDVRTAWGSDRGAAAVISGQADIALAGPEPALYVHNQGSDDPLAIFAQLTATDGSFLVSREPIPDFTWDVVRGRVILGQRPGGMPQMVLEYVLRQHGIEPGVDVEVITNVEFAAIPGAFASGTGEFVTLFEPVASDFEAEGQGHVVTSMGVAGGPLPYTVYMCTDEYMESNPEIIQRFTDALYRGMLWVGAEEAERVAESLAPHFPDTSPEILTSVVNRYKEQGTWAPNPVVDPDHFERLQDVMVDGGVLGEDERVPYDAVVVTRFGQQAVDSITAP